MPYRIHWFKKNLRFQDNEILLKKDNSSSILLYIIEPELWLQKDMSQRQWDFIWESVSSLKTDSALQEPSLPLSIKESLIKCFAIIQYIIILFYHLFYFII